MSKLYNRPIEVYVPSNLLVPVNIFQSGYYGRDRGAGAGGRGGRRPLEEGGNNDGGGGEGARRLSGTCPDGCATQTASTTMR
jgi:hypothetical protein